MAAADALVDNAGGLMCWEAQAAGLPVILYRPLPGHGRFNARALESAGRAVTPHDVGVERRADNDFILGSAWVTTPGPNLVLQEDGHGGGNLGPIVVGDEPLNVSPQLRIDRGVVKGTVLTESL